MEVHERFLTFDDASDPTPAPPTPFLEGWESMFNIAVVFTSVDATAAALDRAGHLARSLGARITLIAPHVVPYPLPLTDPSVPADFQERRLAQLVSGSPVECRVQVYLCRDNLVTLKRVLRPGSLVVIGARKRLWPTREKALARRLRKAGHEVIVAEAA